MELKRGLRGLIPLVVVDDNVIVCYRYGWLGTYRLDKDLFCKVSLLETSFLRRIFSFSSILSRYYGLNEIKAAFVGQNIFISYHYHFYLFDHQSRKLEVIPFDFKGSKSACLHLTSTDKGVLWGEYGYNPGKASKSVFLFERSSGQIKQLYTFEKGKINHIHNIIYDPKTSRCWILTGDFDESAGIYYTDDFFNTVQCALNGSQLYRGCVGYTYNNALYYATDSPDENNFLIKYQNGEVKKLYDLNGSCIYGAICGRKLLFSSTVENQADELNNSKNKYKYNKGKGIKDWYSYIYSFDVESEQLEVIGKSKKDCLPMLAFKYGCFRFPSMATDRCMKYIFCGQSVKKFDNRIVFIDK